MRDKRLHFWRLEFVAKLKKLTTAVKVDGQSDGTASEKHIDELSNDVTIMIEIDIGELDGLLGGYSQEVFDEIAKMLQLDFHSCPHGTS